MHELTFVFVCCHVASWCALPCCVLCLVVCSVCVCRSLSQGKYAIYAMQTNKVIVITMADKEKHDVSYAKKAMGELVKHLMEKEAEYGDQHPYDADPVDGDDF